VYSNLVSHNARDRSAFIARLTDAVAVDGGVLHLAEECEGYAPMELQSAIAERNYVEAAHRVDQAVRGLLGLDGFRFHFSGTSLALLEPGGLKVERTETERWLGVATVERVWAKSSGQATSRRAPVTDPLGAAPSELRERCRRFLNLDPPGSRATEELVQWAEGSANPLAPLALLSAIGCLVAQRATAPWRSRRVDWTAVEELNGAMVKLLALREPG
jgi:hypothetical protein